MKTCLGLFLWILWTQGFSQDLNFHPLCKKTRLDSLSQIYKTQYQDMDELQNDVTLFSIFHGFGTMVSGGGIGLIRGSLAKLNIEFLKPSAEPIRIVALTASGGAAHTVSTVPLLPPDAKLEKEKIIDHFHHANLRAPLSAWYSRQDLESLEKKHQAILENIKILTQSKDMDVTFRDSLALAHDFRSTLSDVAHYYQALYYLIETQRKYCFPGETYTIRTSATEAIFDGVRSSSSSVKESKIDLSRSSSGGRE
jgi:hypothetical protein